MKHAYSFVVIFIVSSILFANCKKETNPPVNPELPEVEPTPCSTAPLRLWLFQQFVNWGKEAAIIAASEELQMSNMANFYTLHFENSSESQYFGVNGEYTNQINSSLKDLKRFWDFPSEHIFTVAAHGSMLQDRDKVIKMYKTVFGYSDDKANTYADSVAKLLKIYPQYRNGSHPAFTFNQFAIPDTIIANVGPVPAKIVIGDGLLEGFDSLGLGKIAPQAILAHEFGHHIQYNLGILKTGMKLNPSGSRRVELMADAYAAYFLSHTSGGAMKLDDVRKVADVFFNTGDCDFTIDSHHGTPTQRKAATEWGYKLAVTTGTSGRIISIREFAMVFDKALIDIVKN